MTELDDAIDEAVFQAKTAFKHADKCKIDHGHAFVKGVDGRKKAVKAMKKHPAIRVDSGGYHGTTIHLEGVGRYLSAQQTAYHEFLQVLKSEGIDVPGARVWARAD